MDSRTVFVSGAGGEMARLLIPLLRREGSRVVALDLVDPPDELRAQCAEFVRASILDFETLDAVWRRHRPRSIYHLAAVLSSKAERDPDLAHRVNVEGTYGLLRLCREAHAAGENPPVQLIFPSSIAVYGLPDVGTKESHGAVSESEWTVPAGVYGCHKLYCELLGSYFSAARPERPHPAVDFRALRFPGLISAETLPSGGTTDYAPEMIHAAAQGKPYQCFVAERTRLPFMTMPDAVEAMLRLAAADASRLTARTYNIKAFSASAGELRAELLRHFPEARIGFEPLPVKQSMVDSWPADLDDSRARRDWGHAPRHDLRSALGDYLVPALRLRYTTAGSG